MVRCFIEFCFHLFICLVCFFRLRCKTRLIMCTNREIKTLWVCQEFVFVWVLLSVYICLMFLVLSYSWPFCQPALCLSSGSHLSVLFSLLGGLSSLSAPWWSETPSTGRWRPLIAVCHFVCQYLVKQQLIWGFIHTWLI